MITVNGKVVSKADIKIDPENDEIRFMGEIVSYSKYIYVMLNKPKGVVSATDDKRDTTVIDLLPIITSEREFSPQADSTEIQRDFSS